MKKKLKQIIKVLEKNKILILFIILLIAVLSPIFINNIYNFPAADDFYGINEIKFLFNGKDYNFINLLQVMTCGFGCGSYAVSRPRPAGDEWDP